MSIPPYKTFAIINEPAAKTSGHQQQKRVRPGLPFKKKKCSNSSLKIPPIKLCKDETRMKKNTAARTPKIRNVSIKRFHKSMCEGVTWEHEYPESKEKN